MRKKARADGRYAVQIYLGKDPETGKRKYKTVYGSTQKEANAAADDVRQRMRRGLDVTSDKDTFADWCERWIKSRQFTASESQIATDRSRLGYFMSAFGSLALREVCVFHVQEVLDALSARNPHTGKPTAKKTLTYIRNLASDVFDYAIENRCADYNPARFAKIAKNAPKSERRALSKEEQRRINETPHRAKTAAMIALYAGLRRGELTALLWSDVDLLRSEIHVTKSYDFKAESLKSTKTEAGVRTVPIPGVLRDYLMTVPRISPYVITSARGHMMTDTAWRRLWESYLCDLNVKYGFPGQNVSKFDPKKLPMTIEPFTLHCLRHTYCTLLYESGVDVIVAKDLMGHADIKTTLEIYTHLDKIHKKKSASKLDEYLCASQDASQKTS